MDVNNCGAEREAAKQEFVCRWLEINAKLERDVQAAFANFSKHRILKKISKAYRRFAAAMVVWHSDVLDFASIHGRIAGLDDLKSQNLLASERKCILHRGSAQIQ